MLQHHPKKQIIRHGHSVLALFAHKNVAEANMREFMTTTEASQGREIGDAAELFCGRHLNPQQAPGMFLGNMMKTSYTSLNFVKKAKYRLTAVSAIWLGPHTDVVTSHGYFALQRPWLWHLCVL